MPEMLIVQSGSINSHLIITKTGKKKEYYYRKSLKNRVKIVVCTCLVSITIFFRPSLPSLDPKINCFNVWGGRCTVTPQHPQSHCLGGVWCPQFLLPPPSRICLGKFLIIYLHIFFLLRHRPASRHCIQMFDKACFTYVGCCSFFSVLS